MMDVDGAEETDPRKALLARSKSRGRSQSTNRRDDGVTDEGARSKADMIAKLGQRKMNRMARQGEADRHVSAAMPKHLVSHRHLSSVFLVEIEMLIDFACSFLAREVWARLSAVRRDVYSFALPWRCHLTTRGLGHGWALVSVSICSGVVVLIRGGCMGWMEKCHAAFGATMGIRHFCCFNILYGCLIPREQPNMEIFGREMV